MSKQLFIVIFALTIINLNCRKFHLVTTYFDKHNRMHEFQRCFEENIKNPYIKKIHVLYENFSGKAPNFMNTNKVKITNLDHFPHHKDFYDYINNNLYDKYVIWANTDIYFDKTLKYLENFNFNKTLIILTRYNAPRSKSKWKRHTASYDCWIYKSPFNYINGNFKINRSGTEHIVANEFLERGYKIINPSLTIKSWHVHNNDYREQIVKQGYLDLFLNEKKYKLIRVPFTRIKK